MKKLIILILLFPSLVFASDVTLMWDANTEPDLAGYRIYRAVVVSVNKSGPYVLIASVGPSETTYVDSIADEISVTYIILAFDTANLESPLSNSYWYWDAHRPAAVNLK